MHALLWRTPPIAHARTSRLFRTNMSISPIHARMHALVPVGMCNHTACPHSLPVHACGRSLAASEDVVGVTLGGILGHMICTGAAVVGGRHLAEHIDERTVGGLGGLLFLAFGAHALYTGPEA
eukprot:350708-Chlamydomonas_euryale.AAC.3